MRTTFSSVSVILTGSSLLWFEVDTDVDAVVDTKWSIAVGLEVLGIFAN